MDAIPVILKHLSTHVQFLKGDKLHASKMKKYEQQLANMIRVSKQIEKIANKFAEVREQKAREQQEQMKAMAERGDATELQKHMMEIQAEQQFKVMKEKHNHQVRVAKAQHGMQIAAAKAENEIRIAQAKASAEMEG